jgi:ubiquinone/menaquinone biosynthesis C-methylase UbiE
MPTTWVDALLHKRRQKGVAPYPHQAAFLLNNPVRRALSNPARKVDSIGRRLTYGRLDLFDLQPEMLDKARRQLELAGFVDVGYTSGEASDGFPYPEDTFGVAFLAAVIGEVPDKPACIRSLRRVLKPGGRLVFAEAFPDPDRMSVRELRDLVEPENFEFVQATGNRWHDIVRFRRPA